MMGALSVNEFHGLYSEKDEPYVPKLFQMLLLLNADPYFPRPLHTEVGLESTQFRQPRKSL